MSWIFSGRTTDDNFVMSEEDGARRLAFIGRATAEDAFPKFGGQGLPKLENLLRANAAAIGRIAEAKFAAGGGFKPQPGSPLRVTLSARDLTSSEWPLVQD